MNDSVLGLLVRTSAEAGRMPPEERPVGRAALRLREEGWTVVFGDEVRAGRMSGWAPRPGGWDRVEDAPLVAIHDRYASQSFPLGFGVVLAEAGDVPIGNPPVLTALVRDKLATQAWLRERGLVLPEVESDPSKFELRVEEWGAAFLKPRFGAFGRGIRRVTPGDALPASGEGAVRGVREPLILQRAVPPPDGWAGWSARSLVQRLPDGTWTLPTRVVRRSREDPVVNVARGAEVADAGDVLPPRTLGALDDLARAVAEKLAGHPAGGTLVELGVDAVIDGEGRPWLIEVNGRPRGRLEALALSDPARYAEAHVEACARPLRALLAAPFSVAPA